MREHKLKRLAVLVGVLCLVAMFAACAAVGAPEAGAVAPSLALAGVLATPVSMDQRIADLLTGARGAAVGKVPPDKVVYVPFDPALAAIGDGDPELVKNLREQVKDRDPIRCKESPVAVNLTRWLTLLEKRHGSGNSKPAAAVAGDGKGGGGKK